MTMPPVVEPETEIPQYIIDAFTSASGLSAVLGSLGVAVAAPAALTAGVGLGGLDILNATLQAINASPELAQNTSTTNPTTGQTPAQQQAAQAYFNSLVNQALGTTSYSETNYSPGALYDELGGQTTVQQPVTTSNQPVTSTSPSATDYSEPSYSPGSLYDELAQQQAQEQALQQQNAQNQQTAQNNGAPGNTTPNVVVVTVPTINTPGTSPDITSPGASPAPAIVPNTALANTPTAVTSATCLPGSDCMTTTGQKIVQQLLPGLQQLVGPLAQVGLMAFLLNPTVNDSLVQPLVGSLLKGVVDWDLPTTPVKPEDAFKMASTFLTKAVALGMGAHVAAQLTESNTSLKFMGANYVAGFVADLAGFQRIAQASMGTAEDLAIRIPMRYAINARVRSLLPNIREAEMLFAERQISTDEFAQLMAYNGMSPDYVAGYQILSYHAASGRMLGQMADMGIYDEAYYTAELQHGGYNDATVKAMLQMLYARAHGDLKTMFISSAIDRYKIGLDDDTKLAANLANLGVRPELLPKYQFAAQLDEDLDDAKDYLANLQLAVEKGVMEPPDMEQMLIDRGFSQKQAHNYAQKESLKLLKAKPKVAAAGGTTSA